jgi:hypothetical protein
MIESLAALGGGYRFVTKIFTLPTWHAPSRTPLAPASSFQVKSCSCLCSSAPQQQRKGQPLTYARAKAGFDALHWFRAEDEELRRRIESASIRPIARCLGAAKRSTSRQCNTTYYYTPQTKEKQAADGSKTFRIIRGTAGDRPTDRINYAPWRRLSSHRSDDGGGSSQSERASERC